MYSKQCWLHMKSATTCGISLGKVVLTIKALLKQLFFLVTIFLNSVIGNEHTHIKLHNW